MKKTLCAGLLTLSIIISSSVTAQDTKTTDRGDDNTNIRTTSRSNIPKSQRKTPVESKYRPKNPVGGSDQPDVLLDIPNVSVDEITVEVDKLKANLSLDAKVANLVSLSAGVDLSVDKVMITIKGVQASALLIVRLDNVRAIIEKTLETLDRNPQIVDKLLSTVDNTVNTVGGVANTALQPGGVVSQTVGTVGQIANTALQPGGVISQTVNTLGQTVQRTVDATGNIVEKTLDTSGKVLSTNTLGKLVDLPNVSRTTNAAGQTVKRVRDTSGAIIELVLDSAGKVISQTIVQTQNTPRR